MLAAGLVLLLAVAFVSGRGEKDTQDFFLGRRKIPGWAACLSFVATEISALTIVGVPATAYRENWRYLQFFVGSALARVVVARLFIPAFYRFRCTTIYEFLRYRFSPNTQLTASFFFLVTRLVASAVRLYAASLAVSVILGVRLESAIALFTLIGIVYIGYGGIKAVVWTNVVQASTFIAAGLACAAYLYLRIPGGLPAVWSAAEPAGRLSLVNLSGALSDPTTLWIAALNGLFGSLAAFGADQEMVQRLLTVETRRDSQKTMLATIAVVLPVTMLFLSIGTLLFVFYRLNPGLPLPDNSDKILSHFVIHEMPAGLKGLMLLAVVMASIDSPLNSLASSFVTDVYRPMLAAAPPSAAGRMGTGIIAPEADGGGAAPGGDERHYLLVSRLAVAAFGVLLAAIAWACKSFEGMLWFAFKINGVTAGSLLGVFLLGLLTERVSNRANTVAMVASSAAMGLLLVLSEKGVVPIGWSWLVVLGTGSTLALGWSLGPALDRSNASERDAPAPAPAD